MSSSANVTEVEHFDAIILGSGQSGDPLALALSAKGKKTALVERAYLGGTCSNYGCTPTKTMVASAEVADMARRAGEYGVRAGDVTVDMAAVRERKRAMVMKWRNGDEDRLGKAEHVEILRGEGSFVGPKQVRVKLNAGGERLLSADWIVIDTGLRASAPPIDGIATVPYLDNISIMELDVVPEHLLVLGGGYVGLEFGQMFRRFGSAVTIVQNGPQLLTTEDVDVAEEIAKILREDGVEVFLDTRAVSVAKSTSGVEMTVESGDGQMRVVGGSHLLVATGRKPNVEELNLAAAGVKTNAHGFVQVNDRLETSAPGVYATGDVTGGPAFTHISYDDYRVLKANLLDGGDKSTRGRMLPYCVFIDPQLGRIGWSERDAAKQGKKVRVARLPMSSVARALETGRTRGFMKALVDAETDLILGAAVLGEEGGEVMSLIETAMMGGLKYQVLRDGIWAHPLFSESMNNLFAKFDDGAS